LLVKSAYSQEKSGGVQIRVNTTCRNYGGVRTPRTPMDRRHSFNQFAAVIYALKSNTFSVITQNNGH